MPQDTLAIKVPTEHDDLTPRPAQHHAFHLFQELLATGLALLAGVLRACEERLLHQHAIATLVVNVIGALIIVVLVPLTAIFLQALIPRFIPRFDIVDLPLLVTILVFVVAYAICTLQYPKILSWRVIGNLMTDNAFLGVVATGMTFVIISGGIDLSVGSVIGFSTVFVALTIERLGMPPIAAFVLLLMLCAAFGAAMGAIIHVFEMPPFIVTELTWLRSAVTVPPAQSANRCFSSRTPPPAASTASRLLRRQFAQ